MDNNDDHHPVSRRMRSDQYLNPQVIYRFNSIFDQVRESVDTTKAGHVLPIFFSKHTRTFHWITIGLEMWNWEFFQGERTKSEERAIFLNEILEELRPHVTEPISSGSPWQRFVDDLSPMYQRAAKIVEEAVKDVRGNHDWNRLHPALLTLYSGFHQSVKKNVEGVVYNCLHKCKGSPPSYITGELWTDPLNPDGPQQPEFNWLFLDDAVSYSLHNWVSLKNVEFSVPEVGQTRETPESAANEGTTKSEAIARILLTQLLLKPQAFSNWVELHRLVVFVPLYDVWNGADGYGGIQALVVMFFDCKGRRQEWLQGGLTRLRAAFPELAAEVTASAGTLALTHPISRPYDLVDHFLKILPYVQDWESVAVFDENQGFLYGYKRKKPQPESFKWGWERSNRQEDFDGLSIEDSDKIEEESGCRYMWWTASRQGMRNLWSRDLIPGIGDEELVRFGHLSIRFEFPATTQIPPASAPYVRAFLRDVYLRQQLELMRRLIPIVRARRAALRSAVSAIMGRNMSHNIGSHVLARYSSKVKDDREKVVDGKTDHRGDFLAYLQRRMDFLAEVATSDRAFWSQALSLKEQTSRLNYGEQQKRFTDTEKHTCGESCSYHLSPQGGSSLANKPIILSFITGKESLLASVEYGAPGALCFYDSHNRNCKSYLRQEQPDVWFACPSGEVGVHALFVILENIIRNSARHGGTSEGTVRIFVRVEEDAHNADLLKLEIIDPRTRLEANGRVFKDGISADVKQQEAERARQETAKLGQKGGHSLYEDGARKKLICLDKDINSILHDEPFLDASGNPNPHYWGVREMQICAHYLRGFPLSDLEGMREDRYPVLEADRHLLPDNSYCLTYTLYLERAKLMAGIVTDDSTYKQHAKERRQRGIRVLGSANSIKPDWNEIAPEVSGYSFLVVEEGITLPDDKSVSALLPVRTFNLPRPNIERLLDDASSGIAWMQPLHERERLGYQEKRVHWKDRNYWGLDARQRCDQESTNGIWRKVQLDTNQEKDGRDRGMWPLADSHRGMVDAFDAGDIAALWVDHPKPQCFKPPQNGVGGLTLLHQAAIPPQGRGPVCRWIHVEALFHDSPHKEALDAANAGVCQELLAAAMPRVAVLDERVQSAAETEIRGLEAKDIWRSMGVWVPEKKPPCDLDHPQEDALKAFLSKPTSHTEHHPIDFLIIHLTVLERLHRDSKNKADTFAQTLSHFTEATQAASAEVVVVTGRGVPAVTRPGDLDFLPNARYLPVSAILEYLVSRPSKLGLMRVIWSAGRPATDGPS